jgi:hypothetical protein
MPISLNKALQSAQQPTRSARDVPLWNGPEDDGITQSLLSRFLCCRERFRLLVIHGLKPAPTFNHRLEYGTMWHLCEATHDGDWQTALRQYSQATCRRYPQQQQSIQQWYNVCKVQYPIYIEWWRLHPDVQHRKTLLAEQTFHVPYALPSGRVVLLRGRWDSVDIVGSGSRKPVYLQENKTKGDIQESQLRRQLQFDLQTMLYLVALREANLLGELPLAGVRYNVVRRPLSGGKGSIRQHKPTKRNPAGESGDQFYARLAGIIKDDPAYWFMRWKCEVTAEDYAKFEQRFLIPILEELCNWWEYVSASPNYDPRQRPTTAAVNSRLLGTHWQYPYGVYNVLAEGGSSELDEYLASGSELGLQRIETLFGELE